jgi:hypothetical protein
MIIPLTPEAEPNSRPRGSLQEGSTGVTRQEGSFDTVLRSGTSVPVPDKMRVAPSAPALRRSLATQGEPKLSFYACMT